MTQPEKTFRQGACSAAVFANSVSKNGQDIELRKVVLQRSYQDANNNWQTTDSFGVNDLPKVIIAAGKAYDYLTSREA